MQVRAFPLAITAVLCLGTAALLAQGNPHPSSGPKNPSENDKLLAEIRALREENANLLKKIERLEQRIQELDTTLTSTLPGNRSASQPRPQDTVLLGSDAMVSGRTVQVTIGVPGALMGKPGKPIPVHPVGGSLVRFSGEGKPLEVMSKKDGSYQVKLAPGKYKIYFKAPGQIDWQPRNEADVKTIEIKSGDSLKLDIPVLTLAVD